MTPPRWLLTLECLALFIILPGLLALGGFHRPTLYTGLWLVTIYCVGTLLFTAPRPSWRSLWHGRGWTPAQQRHAVVRFLACTIAGIALLALLVPDRLFDFPRTRPQMWAMVMLLYPLLSVVPQELVFRSFFFARYEGLLGSGWLLLATNAFVFAFVHLVMQNWVAPLLSLIGGAIFAISYRQHQSLKWAALEHAAYGCMIFTIGLGWYFFRGVTPPPG